MSDKAAGQKTRSPEGCDENGSAAALLLSHVSIQICSFVAPCRRPILIATPLYQSRKWCTRQARRSSEPRLNFRKSRFPCISNIDFYLAVSCNGNADDEKLDDSREENTVRAPLTTTALVEKAERAIHAQCISKSYIHN